MTKFTEMAKKETSVSRILENREKVSVEDIMHDYPTGVTIIDFDLVSLEDTTFPVFAIFLVGWLIVNILQGNVTLGIEKSALNLIH